MCTVADLIQPPISPRRSSKRSSRGQTYQRPRLLILSQVPSEARLVLGLYCRPYVRVWLDNAKWNPELLKRLFDMGKPRELLQTLSTYGRMSGMSLQLNHAHNNLQTDRQRVRRYEHAGIERGETEIVVGTSGRKPWRPANEVQLPESRCLL